MVRHQLSRVHECASIGLNAVVIMAPFLVFSFSPAGGFCAPSASLTIGS
jgi:hypothetical protein